MLTKLHFSMHPKAGHELSKMSGSSAAGQKLQDVLPCHASVLMYSVCDMACVWLCLHHDQAAVLAFHKDVLACRYLCC